VEHRGNSRTEESSQNSITCLLALTVDEIVIILIVLFKITLPGAKSLNVGEVVQGGRLLHIVKSQCILHMTYLQ